MNPDSMYATFRSQVATAGLRRVQSALDALALPAIGLSAEVVDQATLPLGCSKMGGQPDLAPGTAWPVWNETPLAFLAQFDLGEVAQYDIEHALPGSGMLSFFYEAEAQPWGYEASHRGAWRVIYQDVAASALRRIALPADMPQFSRLAPHRLRYSVYLTLPEEDVRQERIGLVGYEEQRYLDLTQQANRLGHQLLGHPNPIQGAMQGECEIHSALGDPPTFRNAAEREVIERAAADHWRLLLQLDSIQVDLTPPGGGYLTRDWGLGFLIYFWIRNDALAARDFSNVWLQLQTT